MRYKIPIKYSFLSVFIIQALIVGSIIIILTQINNRKNLINISNVFKQKMTNNIKVQLELFLRNSENINNINSSYIIDHRLDFTDQNTLIKHFLSQIKAYRNINAIYFANQKGGIALAGRDIHPDSFCTIYTENFKKGIYFRDRIDSYGKTLFNIEVVPFYDATTRPWFQPYIDLTPDERKETTVITNAYTMYDSYDLCMTLSNPVIDDKGEWLGVVAIDLYLSFLSNYLAQINTFQDSQTYITDADGYMVASTENILLTRHDPENNIFIRKHISESDSKMLHEINKKIINFNFYKVFSLPNENIPIELNDQKYFLLISPFQLTYDQTWIILTCISEKEFSSNIAFQNLFIYILIVLLIIISIFLSYHFSDTMTIPIKKLQKSTSLISQGDFEVQTEDINTFLHEVSSLASDFQSMSIKIKDMVLALNNEIENRKVVERALQIEKELLEVTFKSVGEGIIITDDVGKIAFMNNCAEEMIEFSESEAKSLHINQVFRSQDPITMEFFTDTFDQVMQKKNTIHEQSAVLVSKNDKNKINIIFTTSPIIDDSGEIYGVVFVFMDTTEKEKLIETVYNMQRLESIGILAGGIAHEFNNMLQSVFGFIELSIIKTTDEKVTNYLTKAMGSIVKAKALTMHLLTFAKGGNPVKSVHKLEPFIIEFITLSLVGTNIFCDFELNDDLHDCEFDDNHIAQVIKNIVANSIEAMPNGGTIKVEAMNTTEDKFLAKSNDFLKDYVRIDIIDYGVGISNKIKPFVFDPFFTTKENSTGGQAHGLGLTTAYSIMQKHDGQIRVESEEGKWTMVSLFLPAVVNKKQ